MVRVMKWVAGIMACLVFVCLGVGIFAVWKFSNAKQDWLAWKAERIAIGDRFEWSQLAPSDVMDDENFAKAPFVAAAILGDKDKIDPAFNALNITKGEWGGWKEGRPLDMTPLEGEAFMKSPAIHARGLQALRDAIQRPFSKIPVDYADLEMPGLVGFRGAAKSLTLRAIISLREGKPKEALEDILTSLRLAQHFEVEPSLLANLLQVSILNFTQQAIWEGLQGTHWSEQELEQLQQALREVDVLKSARLAWEGERLGVISAFCRSAEGLPGPKGWKQSGKNEPPHKKNWLSEKFFYHNMLALDGYYVSAYLDVLDPAAHRIYPERFVDFDAWQKKHRGRLDLTMARIAVPALGGQLERQAQTQSYCNLAAIACALERYRLKAGTYPEQLHSLNAMNLIDLPLDVTTGKPLIYEKRASDYLLYSVGWDQVDQKGALGWSTESGKRLLKAEKGDWVWMR